MALNVNFANYSGGSTVSAGATAWFYAAGVDVTVAAPLDIQTVLSTLDVFTSALSLNTNYQLVFTNAPGFNGPYPFKVPSAVDQFGFTVPVSQTPPVANVGVQFENRSPYDVVTIQSPSLTGGKLTGTLFSNYYNSSTVSLLTLTSGVFGITIPTVPSGYAVWDLNIKGYIQGTATATASGSTSVWAEAPNTTLTTIPASAINTESPFGMTIGQSVTQGIDLDLIFRNVTGTYNFSIRPANLTTVTAATLTFTLTPN